MRFLLLFATLLSAPMALAQGKMIEYHFGNQITGSTLIVSSDGRLSHQERTCCPPREDEVTQAKLTAQEVEKLQLLIEGAKFGSQIKMGTGSSSFGSSTGRLLVYDGDGNELHIRSIELGDGTGRPQPVEYNSAPEARELEKFVFERVKQVMSF